MNKCVECKSAIATHWSNYLCEECFREFLRDDKEKVDANKIESNKL
ncbi:hypothetical protein [Virgibacillus oceani]|uniref:Uncharacterized protein n=1 Tax=Virgibacillus oceani TaxID=1479511 RepID=A0A917H1W3_9BACI|nr:hypothetical protein [Virgibacillus oceani]GGG64580.1 hypothetical protein GCM10011398_05230 [Virgibacillus oceani]